MNCFYWYIRKQNFSLYTQRRGEIQQQRNAAFASKVEQTLNPVQLTRTHGIDFQTSDPRERHWKHTLMKIQQIWWKCLKVLSKSCNKIHSCSVLTWIVTVHEISANCDLSWQGDRNTEIAKSDSHRLNCSKSTEIISSLLMGFTKQPEFSVEKAPLTYECH